MLLQREEGRERNISVREKHQLVVSCMHLDQELHMPDLGIKPAAKVCALTGKQNCNLLVTGQCSNQLSHTVQGLTCYFKSEREEIYALSLGQ